MNNLLKYKLKIIAFIVFIYSISFCTTTHATVMDNVNSMMNNYKSTIIKKSGESELDDNTNEYKESLKYIPTKYRINGVVAGNQTDSGWCWAYASLKTVDTYFMKKYNSTNNSNWNFSEAHLAYSKYKPFGGWLSLTNDYSNNKTDGRVVWETGGGFSQFLKYAGVVKKQTDDTNNQYKILGPVKESNIPNTQYEFTQNNIQKFNNTTKEVKVLKAIEFQHIKKKYTRKDGYVYTQYTDEKGNELSKEEVKVYRDKIKSHIMNYSGLCSGTHQFNTTTNYWNKDTSSLFTADNENGANHVICIVGWDDDYSREKFNSENKPYNNGAWIAVNSYGTGYGDNGFLYISYDDANIDINMGGILEAEEYSAKPRIEVKYRREENNVTVYLSSPERLNLADWNATYIGTRNTKNETIYTTETVLKKVYLESKKETIKVKDQSGAENQVEIDTANGGLLAQVKTEKTDTINKLKVKILSNNAINNIDDFDLSNNATKESYSFSDDGKEIQIVYINNTEEDVKITGRYFLTDALGNQFIVNLRNENIVIPTKVFKIDINTKYEEIKKGENTYISNISQGTTLENLIKNINTNGTISIYKNNTKITDKNTKISTGMKVQAVYDNKTYVYKAVVRGDTDGDGEIGIKDILTINKHRLGKNLLKDEYELAGDVNQDNKVDFKDLLQVNKYRLGKIKNL